MLIHAGWLVAFCRQVSVGVVAWIVIERIVADRDCFVGDVSSLSPVLLLSLAVVVWPLVLLDVHFGT